MRCWHIPVLTLTLVLTGALPQIDGVIPRRTDEFRDGSLIHAALPQSLRRQ